MSVSRSALYFVPILFFASIPIYADQDDYSYNLAQDSYNYADTTDELNIQAILQIPEDKFIKNENHRYIMMGFSEGSVWTKMKFPENLPQDKYFIEMDSFLIDTYEFHFKNKNSGMYEKITLGILHQAPSEKYFTRLHTVEIPSQTDFSSPFYLRVENENTVGYKPALYNSVTIQKRVYKDTYFFGIFFGLMSAMLLYNLFLYFSLKNKTYFIFVLYELSSIWFIIAIYGSAGALFGSFGSYYRMIAWVGTGFLILFMSMFCRNFLRVSSVSRILNLLLQFFGGMGILIVLLSLFGFYKQASLLSHLSGISLPLVELASGILAYRKGFRPAGYYLFGWLIVNSGYIIISSKGFGFLPEAFFTPYFLPFAMSVESILLSKALADKIRKLHEEKDEARKELLEQKEKEAERLEEMVHQRTKELLEANNTKYKFFSILAHDLRGPIGNLNIIFRDVLKKNQKLKESTLELITQSTENIYNILDDILAWARNQRGEIEFVPQAENLKKLIEKVVMLFSPQASIQNVFIRMEIPPDINVYADAYMFSSIMRNLLGNAVKYSYTGDEILITAGLKDDMAEISVIDHGPGIPEDRIQNLFQINKNSSQNGSITQKGGGLGLVLCKDFVERHGGSINASSIPGGDTRFIFTLKKARVPEYVKGFFSKDPYRSPRDLSGIKMLLVEDSPLDLEVSLSVLSELGCEIDHAVNGLEAVTKTRSGKYDVVLMDISMPIMNGFDAAKTIHKEMADPPLIIALTSFTTADMAKNSEHNIFDGYLKKPLSEEEIFAEL